MRALLSLAVVALAGLILTTLHLCVVGDGVDFLNASGGVVLGVGLLELRGMAHRPHRSHL